MGVISPGDRHGTLSALHRQTLPFRLCRAMAPWPLEGRTQSTQDVADAWVLIPARLVAGKVGDAPKNGSIGSGSGNGVSAGRGAPVQPVAPGLQGVRCGTRLHTKKVFHTENPSLFDHFQDLRHPPAVEKESESLPVIPVGRQDGLVGVEARGRNDAASTQEMNAGYSRLRSLFSGLGVVLNDLEIVEG